MMRDPLAEIASQLSPSEHAQRLFLYVAMGDSFTAGTAGDGTDGWPELLTARLRGRHPTLELRNLAVAGATSDEVVEQLPEAVELEPDLVTVACGANDVLLSTRPDPERYAANLALILGRLLVAVPGVRVATATFPEGWDFLDLGPRTRRRVESGIADCNSITRTIAGTLGIPCLEVAGHPGLSRPENFGDDGLHPSSLGHEHAARGFADLLHRHHGIESEEER